MSFNLLLRFLAFIWTEFWESLSWGKVCGCSDVLEWKGKLEDLKDLFMILRWFIVYTSHDSRFKSVCLKALQYFFSFLSSLSFIFLNNFHFFFRSIRIHILFTFSSELISSKPFFSSASRRHAIDEEVSMLRYYYCSQRELFVYFIYEMKKQRWDFRGTRSSTWRMLTELRLKDFYARSINSFLIFAKPFHFFFSQLYFFSSLCVSLCFNSPILRDRSSILFGFTRLHDVKTSIDTKSMISTIE